MKRYFFLFVLLLALLSILSCKSVTSTQDSSDYLIKEILSNIQYDFNFSHLDSLYQYIHPDFLHKDRNKNAEIDYWENLFYKYSYLSIKDIEVQRINYYKAKVKFNLVFQNTTQITEYNEPSQEFGDLSYFFYDNGKWYLIGKDNF